MRITKVKLYTGEILTYEVNGICIARSYQDATRLCPTLDKILKEKTAQIYTVVRDDGKEFSIGTKVKYRGDLKVTNVEFEITSFYFMTSQTFGKQMLVKTKQGMNLNLSKLKKLYPTLFMSHDNKSIQEGMSYWCINTNLKELSIYSQTAKPNTKLNKGTIAFFNHDRALEYLKNHNKMTKLIGFKVKDKFRELVERAFDAYFRVNRLGKYDMEIESPLARKIEHAGVLEIWFDKVYEEFLTLPIIANHEGRLEGDYLIYGCQKVHFSIFSIGLCKLNKMTMHDVEVTEQEVEQIRNYLRDKNQI